MNTSRIGFGGGCHWCTEAVFQTLRGVSHVEQGFIKSVAPHDTFSEAVIVTFDPDVIPLDILIDVHLRTHASTSAHKMRRKYRSAVYAFSAQQLATVQSHIRDLQTYFEKPVITMALAFDGFKPSPDQFRNYYQSNTEKPFCKTYIDPKLREIRRRFSTHYIPPSS